MPPTIQTMVARNPTSNVFGRRLREARESLGIAQDRLGVMIGLDEGCASARMSRYESGIHEPPHATAQKIAEALNVPSAYLHCDDEDLAAVMLGFARMNHDQRKRLLAFVESELEQNAR